MSERAAVTIVGIGDDGWAGLTETARAELRQAPMIVGSSRQLALLPDLGVRRAAARRRRCCPSSTTWWPTTRALCLLASGDPMLHGIGATLARRLGAGRLRVLPHPSVERRARLRPARLGRARRRRGQRWSARPVEVVVPALQPGAGVLVLLPRRRHPGGTGRAAGRPRLRRRAELTVLEQLGGRGRAGQRPARGRGLGDGRDADRATVAVESPARPDAAGCRASPACPTTPTSTTAQLTKREVRALTLAALAPAPGSCCGTSAPAAAASGSSGCGPTAAAARSRSSATRPGRARSRRNAAALGVPDLQVVTGARPGRRWPASPARTRSSSAAALTADGPARGLLGRAAAPAAGWSPTRSPWSRRRCCTAGTPAHGGRR